MGTERQAIVESMFAALDARDYDGFYDRLDPDCVATTPAGVYRGRSAVKHEHMAILQLIEPHWNRPERVLVSGPDVVAWTRFGGTVRSTGKSFETEVCNVFTFDGDRIIEFREYGNFAPMMRAWL